MAGKKRTRCRELTLHFARGRPARAGYELTYEDFVGMALNDDLVTKLQALAFLMALCANSNAPLERSWAEALAADPEEGEAVLGEVNRLRSMARVREKG